METFKREIATILTQLVGSKWAMHPPVQEVLKEYQHLEGAARTPTQTRRVSLQIFHASRAIDTFLGHIVTHESGKAGRPPRPPYSTLGNSLAYIKANGVGGSRFTPTTDIDLDEIRKDRNKYLHAANVFPIDGEIRRFLIRTATALREAATFPT